MDRRKSTLITIELKIGGIVQGVGFRPFAAKLADSMRVTGWVKNVGGQVVIKATGCRKDLDSFVRNLKAKKPLPSEILHIQLSHVDFEPFKRFSIINSGLGSDEAVMISPDLAVCSDCLSEMRNSDDIRYQHPFISCMACGPRYTIIDALPYDRANTSMVDFPMCAVCEKEYGERKDRRYHAQTISCHDCGPVLLAKTRDNRAFVGTEALNEAVRLLKSGEIIAVKGVGGYHFFCTPFSDNAAKRLRALKNREQKPFAVMFRDIPEIDDYCVYSEAEKACLTSSARPIVLLKRKFNAFSFEVCKTSRFVGTFLPSMGLHWLLTDACGPLIATSANISDRPLIKDEYEIFEMMQKETMLAGVFYNERKIRVPLDDSVIRLVHDVPQMIRRGKGYVPSPIFIGEGDYQILAAGGQLKSAFCLTKGGFAYMSQFLGDLDSLENYHLYEDSVGRMKKLFKISPKLAVCDSHPLYAATDYAKKLGIPTLEIQHHHAHVASVMAEHHLKDSVLGVAFDGTGYGTDGAVWGGEFLICEGDRFKRAAHLEYVDMLGGDGSIKEAWKTALCYRYKYLKSDGGDMRYALVTSALHNHINTVKSSSMGRLFDAVSADLGFCSYNNYEGECAIALENAAAECDDLPCHLEFLINDRNEISSKKIWRDIETALNNDADVNRLALGFHYAIAEMIVAVCKKINIHQVALTGGVFQNKILLELSVSLLEKEGFKVYFNRAVPPNDGGIALGQAYLGMISAEKGRF